MHNPVAILLFIATTTSASPMKTSDSLHQTGPPPSNHLLRRNGLPPVSEVMEALQMQSLLPKADPTPTATATFLDTAATLSSSNTSPLTTLPYTGPGILILPHSSLNWGQATPINVSTAGTATSQGNQSKASIHQSTVMRHLAIIGSVFGAIFFLVACCFCLMDPRIWNACTKSRKETTRPIRRKRNKRHPLPEWMRVTTSIPSTDRSFEKQKAPTLSPYPYNLSEGLKSKFSMTTASEYSCSDECSLDTISPPRTPGPLYKGYGRPPALGPSLPSYSPGSVRNGRLITPVRPPRPPTVDSPSAIESIYYTDVDDQGFYRHPNPIVLEPTSPIINNPPPMSGTNAHSQHLNFLPPIHRFFSSNALGTEALQRHNRSRSAPAFDALSTTKNRFSGATIITQDTLEITTSAIDCSQRKVHRKSTSATSWIRYSEFQHQHHLRLQQRKLGERPSSGPCTTPPQEHSVIGSAY